MRLNDSILPGSVGYNTNEALGIEWSYHPGGMGCGSALELSGLNHESGRIKRFDAMSRQASVI